jgi:hypothetical protein
LRFFWLVGSGPIYLFRHVLDGRYLLAHPDEGSLGDR